MTRQSGTAPKKSHLAIVHSAADGATRREAPCKELEAAGALLRQVFDDIMAEPNPFEHLLPPDDPPPAGAPGQRSLHWSFVDSEVEPLNKTG